MIRVSRLPGLGCARCGDRGSGLRGLGTVCYSDYFGPDQSIEVSGECPEGYHPYGAGSETQTDVGPSGTTATIKDCTRTVVKKGSSGSCVQVAMYRLYLHGYDVSPGTQKVGDREDRAIRAFQRDRGLSADGIVGKNTWSALAVAAKPKPEPGADPGGGTGPGTPPAAEQPPAKQVKKAGVSWGLIGGAVLAAAGVALLMGGEDEQAPAETRGGA